MTTKWILSERIEAAFQSKGKSCSKNESSYIPLSQLTL